MDCNSAVVVAKSLADDKGARQEARHYRLPEVRHKVKGLPACRYASMKE
jgi:hypothetical protein